MSRILVNPNVAGGFMAYDVWFVQEDAVGRKRMVGQFEAQKDKPAIMVWKEFNEGEIMQPTLRLSAQEIDMLRDGLDAYGPTTASNLTFVKDAISVRDRLLTLVETLTAKD